ncbi:MAG: DUF4124 domain-containing protein [Steroidobacteraceae bacterium]|jgi:hypothetical protein
MRLCRSWLAFGLVSVLATPLLLRAATVYKWTDADGVVHFSDQPAEGAEKISTSSNSTRGILNGPAPSAPAQDKPKATTFAQTQVSIVSPAREQTFSGDEAVTAALSVEPPSKGGRPLSITWTLNGAPVGEGADAMSFTLPEALISGRGGYTLGATVTDTASGESKSADPVTFNVLRPSLLSPQHK